MVRMFRITTTLNPGYKFSTGYIYLNGRDGYFRSSRLIRLIYSDA